MDAADERMNLDEAQRKKVAAWIAEGLKLSDIQNRLASELGVRMTYMDVRLLVDDLKLTPKDVELTKPAASELTHPTAATGAAAKRPGDQSTTKPSKSNEAGAAAGNVSLSVDQIARPGAVVSGRVVFTDGNKADWYIDQSGRLGLAPEQAGYRPPAVDVQQFQLALESELSKMGF
jgi:hypothetical protein